MTRIEAIVARTRSHRELASTRSGNERVEVYCKASSRVRVARGTEIGTVRVQFADETGMAVRIGSAKNDRSAFASVGGASPDAMRWAVDTALATGAWNRTRMLSPSEAGVIERLDLDRNDRLPPSERLAEWLQGCPSADWIEAAITVEALCGEQGWLAVRRRARSWALFDRLQPTLAARREARAWVLPDPPSLEPVGSAASHGRDQDPSIALSSEAAAPLVAALATRFHGEGAGTGAAVGVGWHLEDDPLHFEGVAGGVFDDAGFPSARSTLAEGGMIVGTLGGPGTYRRPSFRDAPQSGTSTVIVLPDPVFAPDPRQVVRRCRVLPLEVDSWVLDLGTRSVRADPRDLLSACAGAFGAPRMTAEGVFTPALVFEGLS